MKSLYFSISLFFAFQFCLATDAPLQEQKTSTEKRFDPKAEVIEFYLKLLEKDPNVKRQFEQLAKEAPSYGDVHFGPGHPQIVEWYPKAGSFSAGQGFDVNSHFLIVHPLAFDRPRQNDYQLAIVSEFQVAHKGRVHFEPPDREDNSKLDSNEITITFLGFRNFKLTPTK